MKDHVLACTKDIGNFTRKVRVSRETLLEKLAPIYIAGQTPTQDQLAEAITLANQLEEDAEAAWHSAMALTDQLNNWEQLIKNGEK